MANPRKSPDNVIRFPIKAAPKLAFERVKKRKPSKLETRGQLNLFHQPAGDVLQMPTGGGKFEAALRMDEAGDAGAAALYEEAIAAGDGVADAYCNLGVLRSQASDTAEAFACFSKSLTHDPGHFESHYNLANLYFEASDLRLARLHYELAAKIEPAFPNLYFNLGLVDAMTEDFQAAVEAFSRYQALVPPEQGRHADELLATLQRSIARKS